ncbi:protein FAR1-RELATED SEQUENCE 5-like [Carya illinoinensis]|uniref:protein FAR1-RELATED SEQUENCE 5-like n=1 Tax=Carya illinoinensis TaxID=32201 RepID=UPI001C7185A8|nr:protein FAR1-RELATED SEQUENCE 5-like [Carya illinoinensis]
MADTEQSYWVDSDEVDDDSVDAQFDVNAEDGVDDERNVTLEDCVNVEDGLNVEEGVNLQEQVNVEDSSSGALEPFIGMIFDDVEDAQSFYKAYARRKGFAIRTNHTRLSKDEKKLCAIDYVCTREGFRRVSRKEKERTVPEIADTKIGCKAIMRVKKDGEKWMVNKFVVGHNHILLTPRSASLLRGNRKVTKVQKKLIITLNESGVPTRKIMSVLSKESGGDFNVGCIGKDVENYLGNKRRKVFEEGDAQRLYSYFLERQLTEPGFVYSMQVDKDGCMGSCFWADARSRAAYQYFGDVVTFDATYLTNVYKMPFVPFSGVNHHHQTIMFGCALLVNETAESYTWLLRTWQEAMLGKAPATIITDDDKAMAKAIAEYEKAIDARYFKEKEKDVRTRSTRAILKTPLKIEEEAAMVYTRKSFMIFQDELFNSLRYKATKLSKEGERKTYGVVISGKEKPLYHVTLENGEEQTTCTCHMWEFMGLLCRHILCVFGKKSMLDKLPQHWVKERWTINAKARPIPDIPLMEGQVQVGQDDPMMRKSKLMIQLYDIVELGSQSAKKHNHLCLALEKVHKELLAMEDHGFGASN